MDNYRRMEIDVHAGKIQAIIADRDEYGNKIRSVQVGGMQYVVSSNIEQRHPGLGIGDYLVFHPDNDGTYKIISAEDFERDYALVLENEVPQKPHEDPNVQQHVGVGGAALQGESHGTLGSDGTGGSDGSTGKNGGKPGESSETTASGATRSESDAPSTSAAQTTGSEPPVGLSADCKQD